jgi:hypothetical protein
MNYLPLREKVAERRIENLRHLRRKLTQEIIRALERLRFERRRRTWPKQFKTEAAWRAWCAKDREDELGELLQAEREFEVESARLEAQHEVDAAVERKRRAA